MFKNRHVEELALTLDVLKMVRFEARGPDHDQAKTCRGCKTSRSAVLLSLLESMVSDISKSVQTTVDMAQIQVNRSFTLNRSACMPFDKDFVKMRPHQFKITPYGYLEVRIGDEGDVHISLPH